LFSRSRPTALRPTRIFDGSEKITKPSNGSKSSKSSKSFLPSLRLFAILPGRQALPFPLSEWRFSSCRVHTGRNDFWGIAMQKRTIGQMESDLCDAVIKFEKEYLGRGPKEGKVFILGDMVLVRLKGVLTPAEEQLSKTSEGSGLIKKIRMSLIEGARALLETIIFEHTGCSVVSLHTDISTKKGERVIIFILEKNLENLFGKR
jgi:uncharacterized protein YbcI